MTYNIFEKVPLLSNLKILYHQGKQYIPDVTTANIAGIFRGRPVLNGTNVDVQKLNNLCPTEAFLANPFRLDMGKCTFCGECARQFPDNISFTKDYKLATNERNALIIKAGENKPVQINPTLIRKEIHSMFGGSLKLRQISAAGDNSCEMELNAAGNVNFDMGRFGIEFVASPRHADGIVITGPISENMAEPIQICYDATPEPKLIILVGTDAISGGIFADSPALNRSFLDKYHIDLFVPGNPAHPLTFINGLLDLIKEY